MLSAPHHFRPRKADMSVLKSLVRLPLANYLTRGSLRNFSVQMPLLNYNKWSHGLNPWDDKQEVEGTGAEFRWPAYNERVHLPDGVYRPAYVCHVRDNVKYTYKKMWHVANLVRGLSVDEALKQLDFINKKGAFIAAEVIREAQELAVDEHNVEFRSNLWVAESFATKGKVLKGVRKHARGRMSVVSYNYIRKIISTEDLLSVQVGAAPHDIHSEIL